MGWFGQGGARGGSRARACVGSVLRARDHVAAGGGVALTARHFLTCAHVVNDAVGVGLLHPEHPGSLVVEVVFHEHRAAVQRTARVVHWVPPRCVEGSLDWRGDLAVLELDGPAPAVPPRWAPMVEGQQVRAWYGGGHAATFAEVTVKDCDDRVGLFDGALSGAAIGPGYSGSPLWSQREDAVVGLVAAQLTPPDGALAAHHVIRRGWAIPWQAVRTELERAGAGGLLASRQCADRAAVPHQFLGPLAALLSDPAERADKARRMAGQCGLHTPDDGTAPSYEELAAVFAEHPRALPTLTEVLAPVIRDGRARESLNALHAAGALTTGARLLSHAELSSLLIQLERHAKSDAALRPGRR
jgi:hypothetical protein